MTEDQKQARREYMKVWRREHRNEINEYQRKWQHEHPEQCREYACRYWTKLAAKMANAEPDSEV